MTRRITTTFALVCLGLSLVGFRLDDSSRRQSVLISGRDSALARSGLRHTLDEIFSGPTYKAGSVSAMVLSLRRGTVLYERNGNDPLTPASTTKLFSTAAAFYLQGVDAAMVTEARYDGSIDANGVLHGNLYLVGNGDALLSVNDLEDLADRVRLAGVRRVTGRVYGDATRFDGQTDRSIYSGDHEVVQALGPVTALTINGSTVAVRVSAAAAGPVSIQTYPTSDAFVVVNRTSKGRQRVGVVSTTLADGRQQFTVTGNPGARRTMTKYVTMTRPAAAAAGAFASRLRAGGITIDDGVGEQGAPAQSRFLASFRRPLTAFAAAVNKPSNNFLAEHVFKMVGSLCGDHTNTAARAKRSMLEVLDSLDVPRHACVLNDGSGLSRRNRASAATEAHLLRAIAHQPWGEQFRSTLAIAGRDGTLRRRMIGTPAEATCVGKTGTLRNVSALAGYAVTADGEPVCFAFIANGPNVGAYKQHENLAAAAIASFSYRSATTMAPTSTNEDPVESPEEEPDDDMAPTAVGRPAAVPVAPVRTTPTPRAAPTPRATPAPAPSRRRTTAGRPAARRRTPTTRRAPARVSPRRTSPRVSTAPRRRSAARTPARRNTSRQRPRR